MHLHASLVDMLMRSDQIVFVNCAKYDISSPLHSTCTQVLSM